VQSLPKDFEASFISEASLDLVQRQALIWKETLLGLLGGHLVAAGNLTANAIKVLG
jgi:hypothetical protein